MKRNATAIWQGPGKKGKGDLTTQSPVLNHAPYSFGSRFEEGVEGTNPEELVAAAHAGCFSMKFSIILDEAGYLSENLETKCVITIEDGIIVTSDLTLKAKIPNITEIKFKELSDLAKTSCPVSKLLNAVISLDASLVD